MARMAQAGKFADVISALRNLEQSNKQLIVLIDGPAGAGKTTLATEIQKNFESVNVVHMDDLYDGWQSPINPDLYSRIQKQIIEPHLNQNVSGYAVYDWVLQEFSTHRSLPVKRFLVVEGVGAAGNQMRSSADLIVFIEVPAVIGLSRVLIRDGDYLLNQMQAWQLMEFEYFQADKTKKAADFVIDGSLDLV
jgi:uridine kinase